MNNKQPLINVKPPKSKFQNDLEESKVKSQEDYKNRTWKRILDIVQK